MAKLNTVTCPQLQAGEHPDRWGGSGAIKACLKIGDMPNSEEFFSRQGKFLQAT
nr:hypothetical protein [uncultured Oscillibacter sp.]